MFNPPSFMDKLFIVILVISMNAAYLATIVVLSNSKSEFNQVTAYYTLLCFAVLGYFGGILPASKAMLKGI